MALRSPGQRKLPPTARGPLVAEQFYRGMRAFGAGLVLLMLLAPIAHPRGEAWDAIGFVLFALILAASVVFALRGGTPRFDTRVPVGRALLERKHPCWALAGAASRGELGQAQALLASGVRADETLPGGVGASPLHWVVVGGHAECCRALAEAAANVDLTDDFGWTPLHWAAAWGELAAVECLLEHGAAPDAESIRRETPLRLAARRRHEGIRKALEMAVVGAGDNDEPP